MKKILLLSLFTVALCAPVLETENDEAHHNVKEEEESRVKRAKEVMMFGNQQNEAKYDVKRSNPHVDESNASEDKEGIIYAREPVDISQQENNDDVKSNLMEPEPESIDEDTFPITDTDFPIDESDENIEPEQAYENEMDSRENDEDGLYSNGDYPNYKLLPSLQYPYHKRYNPYNFHQYRHKRSQPRVLKGPQMPHSRVLKRSRRIKRDIYFPSDVYESQANAPYDNDARMPLQYPLTEDDLSYLLDALDNQRNYDDDTVNPYVGYSPYEDEDDAYYEPRVEYAPKIVNGLTYVPSVKRSRDFYPYFEEPQSHFSAFVPEKRSSKEYADAYKRVLELAAALRRQYNYYPGEYEEYRR